MNRSCGSPVCGHRSVAADGRIVCDLISAGDNEVSANLCHDCPAKAIACEHLRFALQKTASSPITVRYATGRVEVLDDQPARIAFLRAACAERVAPINSPRECLGCALHSARDLAPAFAAMPGTKAEPVREPTCGSSGVAATPGTTRGQSVRSGKIIPFPSRIAAAS